MGPELIISPLLKKSKVGDIVREVYRFINSGKDPNLEIYDYLGANFICASDYFQISHPMLSILNEQYIRINPKYLPQNIRTIYFFLQHQYLKEENVRVSFKESIGKRLEKILETIQYIEVKKNSRDIEIYSLGNKILQIRSNRIATFFPLRTRESYFPDNLSIEILDRISEHSNKDSS